MYKKRRITTLKHRITRKKQHDRRILARRLIKGDISLDQLDRLAGPATSGVLRTVNYLSETEGSTLSPALAQAVAAAVAPVSSGAVAVQRRPAAAPAPCRRAARGRAGRRRSRVRGRGPRRGGGDRRRGSACRDRHGSGDGC